MQRFGSRAIALVAVVVATGCASNPPGSFTIAEGFAGAPGVETVVLLPTNLAVELPPQLEAGGVRLHHELFAYLRRRGLSVTELPVGEAQERWLAAAERVRSAGLPAGLDSTAGAFVEGLRESRDFDAVLMPAILLHTIRLKSRTVHWQGVKRSLRFINEPVESSWGSDGFPVTSFHVIVFTPEGRRVYSGTGGLDFVHDADFSQSLTSGRVEIRWQDDPLRNVDHMREAIRVALAPYLIPDDGTQ